MLLLRGLEAPRRLEGLDTRFCRCFWGLLRGGGGPSGAWCRADGSGGDLFEAAQGFVDGLGVGEGVEQVWRDEDDVGTGLHAVVVFAAHTFAEVEVGARSERVELVSFAHIVLSRLRWWVWLR